MDSGLRTNIIQTILMLQKGDIGLAEINGEPVRINNRSVGKSTNWHEIEMWLNKFSEDELKDVYVTSLVQFRVRGAPAEFFLKICKELEIPHNFTPSNSNEVWRDSFRIAWSRGTPLDIMEKKELINILKGLPFSKLWEIESMYITINAEDEFYQNKLFPMDGIILQICSKFILPTSFNISSIQKYRAIKGLSQLSDARFFIFLKDIAISLLFWRLHPVELVKKVFISDSDITLFNKATGGRECKNDIEIRYMLSLCTFTDLRSLQDSMLHLQLEQSLNKTQVLGEKLEIIRQFSEETQSIPIDAVVDVVPESKDKFLEDIGSIDVSITKTTITGQKEELRKVVELLNSIALQQKKHDFKQELMYYAQKPTELPNLIKKIDAGDWSEEKKTEWSEALQELLDHWKEFEPTTWEKMKKALLEVTGKAIGDQVAGFASNAIGKLVKWITKKIANN